MEPKTGVFGSITSFVQSIGKKGGDKKKDAGIKEKAAKFAPNEKDVAKTQIKQASSRIAEESPIQIQHHSETQASLLNNQNQLKNANFIETKIDQNFFGGLYSEEDNPQIPEKK